MFSPLPPTQDMSVSGYSGHVPLSGIEPFEPYGVTGTSKFIIEKLKVEPVHYTSTSYLWENADEIRVRLAKYLVDSVGKTSA